MRRLAYRIQPGRRRRNRLKRYIWSVSAHYVALVRGNTGRTSRTSTRLNNHHAGWNGDRTLGQCDSSNARREMSSEAAGCFSERHAGLEEKKAFEAGGFLSLPRAKLMT